MNKKRYFRNISTRIQKPTLYTNRLTPPLEGGVPRKYNRSYTDHWLKTPIKKEKQAPHVMSNLCCIGQIDAM